ncbi:MAG: hypothetical protein ABI743_11025, partial [bacterium]
MTFDHAFTQGLQSAVEILILTVLIHRFIVIFRSGRATGILVTLLLLALIYGLATLLEMRAIVTVFHTLAPVLGIAVVVVFQPEIRRALERSGNMGAVFTAGARGRNQEMRGVIDTLVR